MARYVLLTSAVNDKDASRMFNEFSSMSDLAQCIIENFEADLNLIKKSQGKDENDELEYNSNDLFEFMDKTFGELVCLTKQEDVEDLYIPYTAAWLKQQVYAFLQGQYELSILEDQQEPLSIEPDPKPADPKPAQPEPSGSQTEPNKPPPELNNLYPKPNGIPSGSTEVLEMESESDIELIY